jgi:hypothetical protein
MEKIETDVEFLQKIKAKIKAGQWLTFGESLHLVSLAEAGRQQNEKKADEIVQTLMPSMDGEMFRRYTAKVAEILALPAPPSAPVLPEPAPLEKNMTDKQISYMVARFLQWRLPENFNPDAGISFKPNFNEHTAYPMKHEPVGTNLFDATQAEAMVRYLIDGMPDAVLPEGQPQKAEITRFEEFDDTDHPFRIWWEKHGQFMLAGGGRRESIWAARGWIAREQMKCGVEVTGDSLHEKRPIRDTSGEGQ